MQEDMDEIRYLIEKDYEDTAENLIGMVPFAKNGHEVTLMLKKAINLATAGGFEVDYEKVSKSLRKFHSLSLEGDLGKAREKLASYEKNSSSPLSPLGVEIIGLANNALESAEFLGEDTSFISSFFNILFPGMLANLEHDWNLIRRKGSYVDVLELRQRYIHNRSMVIKWGKISEFDAEDIIGKMEIKPLSNN